MIPLVVVAAPEEVPPVAVEAAPVAVEAPAVAAGPREQREVFDVAGRVVRRLVLEGGVLREETTFTYDDAGNVVSETSTADGHTAVTTRVFDADADVLSVVVTYDGVETSRETWTWAGGNPATRVVAEGGHALTTTWTWDAYGTPATIETHDEAGALVERIIGDRAPPPVAPFIPAGIAFGVDAGYGSNSDVTTSDVKVGFSIARKPKPGTYAKDPLEVRFSALYQVGKSKGELTNQYSDLKFGLDYNELFPRFTVFLFGDIERNPVANLLADVEIAPVGAKLDILDGTKGFLFDASVAPIWNYRALRLTEGGDCEGAALPPGASCDISRGQASFRVRLGYEKGALKVKDTVEFLPTLTPKQGSILDAVQTEAVLRNTFGFEVKLSPRFAFKESVLLTRDPLLALQADCAAEPDGLLCRGMSLQTGTTFGFTWTFTPPPS